jgi:hypothetical protein
MILQEESAIFIENVFTTQVPMIGVTMGCGRIRKMMVRSFLLHSLSFIQMIEG